MLQSFIKAESTSNSKESDSSKAWLGASMEQMSFPSFPSGRDNNIQDKPLKNNKDFITQESGVCMFVSYIDTLTEGKGLLRK